MLRSVPISRLALSGRHLCAQDATSPHRTTAVNTPEQ
jgi:hypothetical protein